MKIIVCYKWVLDAADLRAWGDFSVETSAGRRARSASYDRNAIETAMRLLSRGRGGCPDLRQPDSAEIHQGCAIGGPTSACWVNDPPAEAADGA